MGFLDSLAGMLTPATMAAGNYMQARRQAQQQQFQNNMMQQQMASMERLRQAQEQDIAAQAADRQQQAKEREAAAAQIVTNRRTAFKMLGAAGLLPQGVTPDMQDQGDWSKTWEEAQKAKSQTDLENLKGKIQKDVEGMKAESAANVARINREGAMNVEKSRETSAANIEASREASAQKIAGLKGKGGATANAQTNARIVQYGAGVHALIPLLKAADALNSRRVPVAIGEQQSLDPNAQKTALGAVSGYLTRKFDPIQGQYDTAIAQYTMPVIHAINSSARVSHEQSQIFNQSVRFQPGESPEGRMQKIHNLVDLTNEARRAVPPEAAAAVDASLSPEDRKFLQAHGFGTAPTGGGMSLINAAGIDMSGDDTGDSGDASAGVSPAAPTVTTTPKVMTTRDGTRYIYHPKKR